MRFAAKTILLFNIVFLSSFYIYPQSSPTTDEIVKQTIIKYILSCGGKTAIENISSKIIKGTILRGVSGKMPIEVKATSSGKWFYNQVFSFGEQISYGYDSNNAWVQTIKDITEMDPEQVLDFTIMFDLQAPLKLNDIFCTMNLSEKREIDGKTVTIINAETKNGLNRQLVFDSESGMLIQVGEIKFANYIESGSIKYPNIFVFGDNQTVVNKKMRMEFTSVDFNKPIDDSIFDSPFCLLPIKDAPLYKKRIIAEVSMEDLDKCVGNYEILDHPENIYEIYRQDTHLMFVLKFNGIEYIYEIIPESSVDYFMKFIGWEFHFTKDTNDIVNGLIINTNREIKTRKIN